MSEDSDITFVVTTPHYDGSRRYDVYVGSRAVGVVRRDDRHVYRTTYKGKRYGYDRSHSCWRIEPPDSLYSGRCFPTRSEAAAALSPLSPEKPA
jgi:hypothetical protein